MHGLGVYWLRLGELNKAAPLLKESLVRLPDNVRFLIDNANINLKLEDYKKADGLLSHAQLVEPNNQEIWAFISLKPSDASDRKKLETIVIVNIKIYLFRIN